MTSELIYSHHPFSGETPPNGWSSASLGDFAVSVVPGFASGHHNGDQRGVPHVRPMNVDREGRLNLSQLKYVDGKIPRELRRGDIAFNNTNSSALVGKTASIDTDMRLAFSNHMTRVRLEEGVDANFVARQLHYFWMAGYFRHRCVNHVNQASISAEPLTKTVPLWLAPTDEQRRIAESIDELMSMLDKGVSALVASRLKLTSYRASVLKAAVEGALTAEWRAMNPDAEQGALLLERILTARRVTWEEGVTTGVAPGHHGPRSGLRRKYREPKTTDQYSGDIPNSWCWATLDQIGRLDRGRSKHRPRDEPSLYGGAYPFVQTADIRRARQMLREHSQTYNDAGLQQSCLWPAGTLCITIAANIAETAILSYPACFPDSVVGALFDETLVSVRYVELFLRSARTRIASYAPATAQKNINNEILRALRVPLPPFDEQEAIVEIVEDQMSVVDHVEADIKARLASAESLRLSILRHAFRGELVLQQPNDEPASELLKRIAAERAVRDVAAKPGKRRTKLATKSHKRKTAD